MLSRLTKLDFKFDVGAHCGVPLFILVMGSISDALKSSVKICNNGSGARELHPYAKLYTVSDLVAIA